VVSGNIELTRRVWDLFNRREYEQQLRFIHPELEWRPAQGPGGPEGTVYRGRAEYEQWLHEEVVPVWESFKGEDLEITELADGRIMILGQLRGKGRASGVEVGAPFGQIAEIRDGMVVHLTGYLDHDSTRKAAAL
jgi:ketosteroid isomerase-like protein